MPPVFDESDFIFEGQDSVPDHINDFPNEEEYLRDPSKYHLDGEDTFEGLSYVLALNIGDLPTAQMLHAARLRHLEKFQPTATSGGQNGIQDRVYLIAPEA